MRNYWDVLCIFTEHNIYAWLNCKLARDQDFVLNSSSWLLKNKCCRRYIDFIILECMVIRFITGIPINCFEIEIFHENQNKYYHDDVIRWKHFPRHWPFAWGIHRQILTWWRHQMETFSAILAICAGNSLNSLHKGPWRWALLFSLIRTRINGWVNNVKAGDLRHHRAHCDVTVMGSQIWRRPCQSPLQRLENWILSGFWLFTTHFLKKMTYQQ